MIKAGHFVRHSSLSLALARHLVVQICTFAFLAGLKRLWRWDSQRFYDLQLCLLEVVVAASALVSQQIHKAQTGGDRDSSLGIALLGRYEIEVFG